MSDLLLVWTGAPKSDPPWAGARRVFDENFKKTDCCCFWYSVQSYRLQFHKPVFWQYSCYSLFPTITKMRRDGSIQIMFQKMKRWCPVFLLVLDVDSRGLVIRRISAGVQPSLAYLVQCTMHTCTLARAKKKPAWRGGCGYDDRVCLVSKILMVIMSWYLLFVGECYVFV